MCNLEENLLFSTLIHGSVFNDYIVFYGDVMSIEQFIHGRLDRALINSLGLAVFRAPLCFRCTWCYMQKNFFDYIFYFTL